MNRRTLNAAFWFLALVVAGLWLVAFARPNLVLALFVVTVWALAMYTNTS